MPVISKIAESVFKQIRKNNAKANSHIYSNSLLLDIKSFFFFILNTAVVSVSMENADFSFILFSE